MSFVDRSLVCRECGQEFTFTAGEQEFFAQKGFTNEPSRCPDCRAARKSQRGAQGYDSDRGYSDDGQPSRARHAPEAGELNAEHQRPPFSN